MNLFVWSIIALIVFPFIFSKQVNFSFDFNYCFISMCIVDYWFLLIDWFVCMYVFTIIVNCKHVQFSLWLPDMILIKPVLNWIVLNNILKWWNTFSFSSSSWWVQSALSVYRTLCLSSARVCCASKILYKNYVQLNIRLAGLTKPDFLHLLLESLQGGAIDNVGWHWVP